MSFLLGKASRSRSSSGTQAAAEGLLGPCLLEEILDHSLLRHICTFLTLEELQALGGTDRHLRDITSASDFLWKPVYEGRVLNAAPDKDVKKALLHRLEFPQEQDEVQVLWSGVYNLLFEEVLTTFEGQAWWQALVVAQQEGLYLIHYSQWESGTWDEWVSRDRIRWPINSPDVEVSGRERCASAGVSPLLSPHRSSCHYPIYCFSLPFPPPADPPPRR